MEGGRSQEEEDKSQGRTMAKGEGRNTCEHHGRSLLLWEARRDSTLEGVQGIGKGVTRQSLQGDRGGGGSTGRSDSIQREDTRHKAPSRGYVHSPPCKEGSSIQHSPQPGQGQAAAREAPAGDPAHLQGRQGEKGRHCQGTPAHGHPMLPGARAGSCPSSSDPIKGSHFKPPPPSLGASNPGMPLASHSPEQGGRAEETPSLARGGRT